MELISFWVISPADGQEGRPEPIKLTFMENGDIVLVSLCEDPEYRGAYRLLCGAYSYTGTTLTVKNQDMNKIAELVDGYCDEEKYRSALLAAGLMQDREWDLFYAVPQAWKALRLVAVRFGDE